MASFGPMPQTVICPNCQVCITTRTQTDSESSDGNECLQILALLCSCFLICGLCAAACDDGPDYNHHDCGPDCCICLGSPCGGGGRRAGGVNHYCPQCNCLIGRYNS